MTEPHPLTLILRKATERKELFEESPQWYVDDLVIDCPSDLFWSVVDKELRKTGANDYSSYDLGELAYNKLHENFSGPPFRILTQATQERWIRMAVHLYNSGLANERE